MFVKMSPMKKIKHISGQEKLSFACQGKSAGYEMETNVKNRDAWIQSCCLSITHSKPPDTHWFFYPRGSNGPRTFFTKVQSHDQLGHQGDIRDNLAEILFQSFLQEAPVSSSGKNEHCKTSGLLTADFATCWQGLLTPFRILLFLSCLILISAIGQQCCIN